MTEFSTLEYVVRNNVAYVTFATPDRLNSITEERLIELAAAVDKIHRDETLHAAVVTGSGRAFCVGLDLELLKRAFEDVSYFESVVERLQQSILRLEEAPIPTIAVVNGFARAGGLEIALGCDFLIIADKAKIGDNHTQIGVMPGGGSTKRLPQRIGVQRAKELIFTGKWLTGQEAQACGLALRSVPAEKLEQETERLLDQFRDKRREVLCVVKKTMRESADLPVRDGVNIEIKNFISYLSESTIARDGFWESIGESRQEQ